MPVVCVAIVLLVVWPRATDLTNANQEFAANNPTSAVSAHGLSSKHISPRQVASLKLQPPGYQPGVEKIYYCGNGYGHVKITSPGTEFPRIQQKYFAEKGIFLINEVRRITGIARPQGFYFDITFFKSPADYSNFCRGNGMANPPAAFCLPIKTPLYSPISAQEFGSSETTDVIAHQMIHAIVISS